MAFQEQQPFGGTAEGDEEEQATERAEVVSVRSGEKAPKKAEATIQSRVSQIQDPALKQQAQDSLDRIIQWRESEGAQLRKEETIERVSHALAQLGASIYGMKHGVDTSGIKFERTDWDSRRKELDGLMQTRTDALARSEDRTFRTEEAGKERTFRTTERQGEQEFRSGETAQDRAFRTGEREAEQGFRAGETAQERAFRIGERESEQGFRAGETAKERTFRSGERQAEQGFRTNTQDKEQTWRTSESKLDRESAERIAGLRKDGKNDEARVVEKFNQLRSKVGSEQQKIMTNPRLDDEQKASAIRQLYHANAPGLGLSSEQVDQSMTTAKSGVWAWLTGSTGEKVPKTGGELDEATVGLMSKSAPTTKTTTTPTSVKEEPTGAQPRMVKIKFKDGVVKEMTEDEARGKGYIK